MKTSQSSDTLRSPNRIITDESPRIAKVLDKAAREIQEIDRRSGFASKATIAAIAKMTGFSVPAGVVESVRLLAAEFEKVRAAALDYTPAAANADHLRHLDDLAQHANSGKHQQLAEAEALTREQRKDSYARKGSLLRNRNRTICAQVHTTLKPYAEAFATGAKKLAEEQDQKERNLAQQLALKHESSRTVLAIRRAALDVLRNFSGAAPCEPYAQLALLGGQK